MLKSHIRFGDVRPTIKTTASIALACLMAASMSVSAGKRLDIDTDQWISIGAGIRAPLNSEEDSSPSGDERGRDYEVESVRLYINGQVHENIKFTLNTEGDFEVLDAFIHLELSPQLNLWIGQMLTPADRIELNGPYYALTWNQYTQPLFPSDQGGEAGSLGRDDGLTFWGSAGKLQYALGIFDGLEDASNVDDERLYAGRIAYNFLNKEDNPGYYTSSTYYGGLGNILTLGLSVQSQDGGSGTATTSGDFIGYALDLLSETVLSQGDVVTFEAEYKLLDADFTLGESTPADADADTNPCFCLFDGDSTFATIAYLVRNEIGPGKVQPYLRYVSNNPEDGDSSHLTEVGANYVISGHNARLNINYGNGDANITGYRATDENGDDVGDINFFSFGVQIQL